MEKIGVAAYRLDLPPDSLVHPVFHISQLKPFTPDYTPVYGDISKMVNLTDKVVQPVKLLDRHLVKKGNSAIPQVKIKWLGISEDATT